MFRETLLESAPGARRRKRWPMVLAVALEVTVCSVLIAVPLFSTGIIPIAARTPVVFPKLDRVTLAEHPSNNSAGGTGHAGPVSHTTAVVTFGNSHSTIDIISDPFSNEDQSRPDLEVVGRGNPLPNCTICISTNKPPRRGGPYKVSDLTEGYLLHRVEPIYPRPAIAAGIRGEVRLHAIIGRDGTVQSLTLVSGHPLLARAAMEAVAQWRYRPYLLNHEPVEVETLITVNFTPGR